MPLRALNTSRLCSCLCGVRVTEEALGVMDEEQRGLRAGGGGE